MNGEQSLTPAQTARAWAALDAWYANPGGSDYKAPGVRERGYEPGELERMHAALEAPTAEDALETFGAGPDPRLSSPGQDADNRALMTALRERLGHRTLTSQVNSPDKAEAAEDPRPGPPADFPDPVAPGTRARPAGPSRATGRASSPPAGRAP
jgi:hypothetical protein